jgi:hypothetical protein
MSAATIRFDNLLTEASYAFHTGDYRRAEGLLAEARTITAFERRLSEEAAS